MEPRGLGGEYKRPPKRYTIYTNLQGASRTAPSWQSRVLKCPSTRCGGSPDCGGQIRPMKSAIYTRAVVSAGLEEDRAAPVCERRIEWLSPRSEPVPRPTRWRATTSPDAGWRSTRTAVPRVSGCRSSSSTPGLLQSGLKAYPDNLGTVAGR